MYSRGSNSASLPYEVGGSSVPRRPKNISPKKSKPTPKSDPIDENQQAEIVSKLKLDAGRQANNGRTTFYYLFLTIAAIFAVCLWCSMFYPAEIEHQLIVIFCRFYPNNSDCYWYYYFFYTMESEIFSQYFYSIGKLFLIPLSARSSGTRSNLRFHLVRQPREFRLQFIWDSVPLWGFCVYYLFSIVSFVASAMVVKHGFRRRSPLRSIPFLTSLIIGMLSAVSWLIIIFSKTETSNLFLQFSWLPFSNLTGLCVATYVDRDADILLTDAEEMESSKYAFKEI